MSKKTSGAKTAGKIFAAFTGILLIIVLTASWFIGGQTRTAERFCAAVGSGDLNALLKTTGGENILPVSGDTPKDFKENIRSLFMSSEAFSELEDTDIISSKADITEHRMLNTADKWQCTADVDFFRNGMSVSVTIIFDMTFLGGKWVITGLAVL